MLLLPSTIVMSENGKTTSIPGQLKKPSGIKQNRRSSIGETDGDSTVSVVKGWRISRQPCFSEWNSVAQSKSKLPYGPSANVHTNPEQCGNKKSPPRSTFTRQTATANRARFSLSLKVKRQRLFGLRIGTKRYRVPFPSIQSPIS